MTLIKLKKSTISGSVPTVSELEQGELGMNVPDGLIFLKKVSGSETIQRIFPFTGSFTQLSQLGGVYGIDTGIYVHRNYKITLTQIQNSLNFTDLESVLSGFNAKLIVTQSNAAYRIKVPTGIMVEGNSKSNQSFGYTRFNISEITSGPPRYATFRTVSAHGLSVGDMVFIDNYTGDKAAYNGLQEVTDVVDSITFTVDTEYQNSGSTVRQPTSEKFEVCFNLNGVSMFELNYDGGNMYIHKIGDFD